LPTLYDCADLAGVSTATVSRVLHGYDRVSDKTRARVLEVIERLGYVPDGAAQSLSLRRKEIVGLAIGAPDDMATEIETLNLLFTDQVLRGVEMTASARGWSVLITVSQLGDQGIFKRLNSLSGKVDGLIVVDTPPLTPAELARLASRAPIVVVAGVPDETVADVVAADNFGGSVALTRHLVEHHGPNTVHYVLGPKGAPDATERFAGFRHVLDEHPNVRLTGTSEGTFTADSGRRAVQSLLAQASRQLPDAIVCANDPMAIAAVLELQAHHISVPGDVAVVGFDGIYAGELLDPPLTTVRQPMRALGERACDRLFERIANPQLERTTVLLPTELVVKRSCGCPAEPRPRPLSTSTAKRRPRAAGS